MKSYEPHPFERATSHMTATTNPDYRSVELAGSNPTQTASEIAQQLELRYRVAPLTLAQLHLSARAEGKTDGEVWAAWKGVLDAAVTRSNADDARRQPVLYTFDVQDVLLQLGIDGFYAEWIDGARASPGLPLIGLLDVQTHGDDATVRLGQVQDTWFSWQPTPTC